MRDAEIILDYIDICERLGVVLDPAQFPDLCEVANAIAQDACRDGDPPPDLIDRILAGDV